METKNGGKSYNLCNKCQLFSIKEMISLIIKLAQSQPWYGVSEVVEIAKGKNQYKQTWKQTTKHIKRTIKSWQTKSNMK